MSLDLSIVIISYNSRAVLPACLDSIREHLGDANYETIIVDNASPDGTAEMIELNYPWVRVIRRSTNGGLSAAINDGVAASSGAIIAQLNPDIRLDDDALTPLVAYLNEHQETGIVAPKLLNDDGSLQLSCRAFPGYGAALFNRYSIFTRILPRNRFSSSYLMSDFDHSSIREVDWVSGAAIVISRRVFDEVGGWDSGFFMFAEDVDLCRRVRDAGYSVVYNPASRMYHTIGVSAHPSSRMIIERHKSMWRYYRKHLRGNIARDAATAAGIAARATYMLGRHAFTR